MERVAPPRGPGQVGPGQMKTAQSPPFSLPIRYMLFGILGFLVFACDLAYQGRLLGQSGAFSPSVIALTHILTLGSLMAFVMGAVYQLSTVAFMVPIRAQWLAKLNFWLYAVCVTGLVLSMQNWWTVGLAVFGSLAVVSLLVYAGVMLASLAQGSKERGPMLWFVQWAHGYLIVGVTFALLMVLSFVIPSLGQVFTRLLFSHILFLAGGFFSFLVIGFSYKLLPMFTLSHGFSTKVRAWTFVFAQGTLWLLVVGVWTEWSVFMWMGAAAGVLTFATHLVHTWHIIRKRMRKKFDFPIRTEVTAVVLAGVALLVVLGQLALKQGTAGWQTVLTFYILGWITLTVLSFSYKIVPFLIWTERYSQWKGAEKPPLIGDLLNLERSRPVLIAFALGLFVLCIGSAAVIPWLSWIGAALMALSILGFCIQMFIVVDLPKLLRELQGQRM